MFINVNAQALGETVKESQSIFMDRLRDWGHDFYNLLPNFIAATLLLIAVYFAASVVKRSVILWANRRGDDNLGDVLGAFIKWGIVVWGALVCLSIVVPSMKSGDVLATLGVGSVALGFALKDILQNWFAGMLLLLKRPFNIGDMVTLKGYEGTIERIETRSTLIKTYDGKRVVVPNADVYSSVIIVHSAHPFIRGEYDVHIAQSNDFAKAREIIARVIDQLVFIEKSPAPEIFIHDMAQGAVAIRLRWWINHQKTNNAFVRGEILNRIKIEFEKAGITLPTAPD